MVRTMFVSSALLVSTSALAAPAFPLTMECVQASDAGLGLITETLQGSASINDPDGDRPFAGDVTLFFDVNGYPESIVGDWTFGGGTFTASVDQQTFDDTFGDLIPASTTVTNTVVEGTWNKTIKCVEGDITADITFYGIPIGNQTVANFLMCRRAPCP